ncbi:MAG TPA: hypothetical protein PLH57_06460, partial [Oligoflexia bacterium]|nr:hypothetical protein [Oligoflexia bacterium]
SSAAHEIAPLAKSSKDLAKGLEAVLARGASHAVGKSKLANVQHQPTVTKVELKANIDLHSQAYVEASDLHVQIANMNSANIGEVQRQFEAWSVRRVPVELKMRLLEDFLALHPQIRGVTSVAVYELVRSELALLEGDSTVLSERRHRSQLEQLRRLFENTFR